MMSMRARAENYNRAFAEYPSSHLTIACEQGRDVLRGEWAFGQDYRNRNAFYGAYPGDYLERLAAVFPDHSILPGSLPLCGTKVLHAFSGSIGEGPYDRCDIRQPSELQCDVRDLPGRVPPLWYNFIAADPPYSDEDAEKYKAPPLDRGALTESLAITMNDDAHLAWLDTTWPMHTKDLLVTVGRIYILRSTNHRIRLLSIFERVTHG